MLVTENRRHANQPEYLYSMNLEEINEIADKAERLRLFKEYLREELDSQKQFDKFDAVNDDNADSSDNASLRDEAGGMMSRS